MKIRPLASSFRVGGTRYLLKMRTGQVCLYAKYEHKSGAPLGFDILRLRAANLGQSFESKLTHTWLEVFPRPEEIESFEANEEVDAWTAFQELVDKQAKLR